MADLPFELDDGTGTLTEADLDGVYVYDDQHVLKAQTNLIELFAKQPRNQGVMEAMGEQTQELENIVRDLFAAFYLSTAAGDQLDKLGAIVGESRQGRTDTDYRAAVRVRQLVNRSNGKAEELIAIAQAMVPAASIYYAEHYPASTEITWSTLSGISLATLYAMLRQAKPAGVRLMAGYGDVMGAVDGSPAGSIMGAVDGNPLGFTMGGGT